jgi:hypothetical protein
MFAVRATKLLLPLALLGALAAVGGADDAKPDDKTDSISLPGPVARGVVNGDHFYAVTAGRLIDVDLKARKVKEFDGIDAKLAPHLDVADGKALVAADGRVSTLDLSTGKTLHSAEFKGDVRGLGFAGDDKAFVVGGAAVTVVDLASGETMRTIDLVKKDKDGDSPKRKGDRGNVISFQKVDKTLYVLDFFAERLSVVDLDAGKVADEIHTPYWSSGVRVVGDKAFLAGVNLSYGINSPQFGYIDLKTKKYTAISEKRFKAEERIPDGAFDQLTLFSGELGDVVLPWGNAVLEYDAEGILTARARLPKDAPGRLVGVWQGMALTAGKDTLVLTPLLVFGC